MFSNKRLILAVLSVVIALVLGAWWLFLDDTQSQSLPKKGAAQVSKPKLVRPVKVKRKIKHKYGIKQKIKNQKKIGSLKANDDADEEKLTKLQREVLKELRDALDAENFKRLVKVLARFNLPSSKMGLAGDVPKLLRQEAVSALGWFGSLGIPELLGFMADADEEIAQDAFSQFETALDDWDMGDRERAAILVEAMKAINDSEQIDTLLFSLNNMRNSVKGEAILNVLSSGTEAAKAVMLEQLGVYTDAAVESAEGVKQWLEDNPDDEDDEEFYGPQKDDA